MNKNSIKKSLVLLFILAAGTSAQTETKQPPVADCGCEASVLPETLASVNTAKFSKNDFSPVVAEQIRKLQEQVVEARKAELDLLINSKLLAAEAKKRGITTRKLLETEVVQKVKEPTDAEAQAFYDENKARLQKDFASLKPDIIGYLRQQRQTEEADRFAQRLRAAAVVKKQVEAATSPATAADRARIFAHVNNEPIRSADVEDSLCPMIFSVQEQVYNLRKNAIDLFINDTLLTQHAAKQNIAPKALLDTEVYAKVPTVTEAAAQAFYNENKARINGDFATVKQQVIDYLQEQERNKHSKAFADKMRAAGSVQVFLTAPVPPVYRIPITDQPVRGDAAAMVTLVEFSDFQCPSCAATQPILYRLLDEYKGKVKLVVVDYPLTQHAEAFKAAEAAEAAREQGKYWEYADLLMKNQSALKIENLKAYAEQLGLNRAKFDAALDSGKFSEKVDNDIEEGNKVGVGGTPTTFVNGRRAEGTYEGLKAAIENALKAKP